MLGVFLVQSVGLLLRSAEASLLPDPPGGAMAGDRPRVLISTDIGGSDPDDFQALVYFLVHSNLVDTEGLISSPPGAGRVQHILEALAAYEQDYDRLRAHSPAYPAPDALRAVTKQGAIFAAPAAGFSTPTEGSNWIIQQARRLDDRPLYILVWGSITDLAQAIHDDPGIKPFIRVYSIGSWNTQQDPKARNYLYQNHNDFWWIEADTTFRGMYVGGNQSGDLGNLTFVQQHVKGHGALGDFFWAKLQSIKMGDTPSLMYLLRGEPDSPETDHWGGRFRADSHGLQYWRDLADPLFAEGSYPGAKTVNCWRENYLREWQRRMDWASGSGVGCLSAVSPADNIGRAFRIGSVPALEPVTYTFQNLDSSEVSYTVSSSAAWLRLDRTGGGPIGSGGSDGITGVIDPTGLVAGGHVCTLTFTDNCYPPTQHIRRVLLSIDEAIRSPGGALQQFNAEFTTFTGSDGTAVSPLSSCEPGAVTDREFLVGYSQMGSLPPDWLTQGSIGGAPTTARFLNPLDGQGGRARYQAFLPFDSAFDPTKGMAVAWSMRVGSGHSIVRGPVQIVFPRVTGPFGTDAAVSSVAGDVFNVYVRLQDGTRVGILDNGGGAVATIDETSLATSIADTYHQWTAAVCYNIADHMAYWNLWVDGEKLMFGGSDGTVVGPGGDVFSFRTGLDDVTGDPYIGLGELGSGVDAWDFEFDWVRMLSYSATGCPFWDGQGCGQITTVLSDFDLDGDVDQEDFGHLQVCLTDMGDIGIRAECQNADMNGDMLVDKEDVAILRGCVSGPGTYADRTCDDLYE